MDMSLGMQCRPFVEGTWVDVRSAKLRMELSGRKAERRYEKGFLVVERRQDQQSFDH